MSFLLHYTYRNATQTTLTRAQFARHAPVWAPHTREILARVENFFLWIFFSRFFLAIFKCLYILIIIFHDFTPIRTLKKVFSIKSGNFFVEKKWPVVTVSDRHLRSPFFKLVTFRTIGKMLLTRSFLIVPIEFKSVDTAFYWIHGNLKFCGILENGI